MEQVESPKDVRRLVLSIIDDILERKKTIPQADTVVQLLNVWLRAYEMEKASELEARIEALEARK